MAEVGVLELTIQDNSEVAAGGLDKLAGALVRVQNAVKNGLDLSGVSGAVTRLAKVINTTKGTNTAIKNLTELFNAISRFSKIKEFKIDTKPFEILKETLGDGLNTGTAASQMSSLVAAVNDLGNNGTAAKLRETAQAMREYADAAKAFNSITKRAQKAMTAAGFSAEVPADVARVYEGVAPAVNTVEGAMESIQSTVDVTTEAFKEHIDILQEARDAAGSAAVTPFQEINVSSAEDALARIDDLFAEGSATEYSGNVTQGINEIADAARNTRSEVDNLIHTIDRLFDIGGISEFIYNAGWFGDTQTRIGAGESPMALPAGGNQLLLGDGSEYWGALEDEGNILQIEQNLGDLNDYLREGASLADQLAASLGYMGKGGSIIPYGGNVFGNAMEQAREYAEATRGVAENMMPSTWVRDEEYWKPDFVMGNAGDFSHLKESAIEAEYVIDGAMKNTASSVESASSRIHKATERAAMSLDQLKNRFMNTERSNLYGRMLRGEEGERAQKAIISDAAQVTGMRVDEIRSNIAQWKAEMAGIQQMAGNNMGNGAFGDIAGIASSAGSAVEQFGDYEEDASSSTSRFASMIETLKTAFNDLKSGMGKVLQPLTRLIHRFGAIAKYRMLRAVLKHITEGFKEGFDNLKGYKEAIGDSFYNELNDVNAQLLTMKNSIGAAVAPALQAAIPVLQSITSMAINAFNAVNQLISLLSGKSSWTRATNATAESLDNVKKSAGGAGGAMKDLLASWDELNIIQSESGGGGGGGGLDTDEYLSMFEEVGQFEQWIQDLVDGINKHFGGILKLAKDIGKVILGWKVASALTGFIGDLFGIMALGSLFELEFRLTAFLNDQYLKTKEEGYLILDVLQALLGGVLANKILSKVLGGKFAKLGIPIMLAVSATAGITTLIGSVDTDTLSEESLKLAAENALKAGGAAAYLAYASGYSIGSALAGGAAATLLTFGVALGLKALVQGVDSGVTVDTIKAEALSSLAIGGAGAIAAKLLVPGVTGAQALGFGAATGAAAFLFTIGATIGIRAVVEAAESGVTADTIKNAALASLALGGGALLVAKMAGYSWLSALGIGGWAALGTVAVLTAGIGIMALINPKRVEVDWGDKVLTQKQVEDFVNGEVFDVKLPIAIKLVQDKIQDADKAEQELSDKVGEVLPIINTLLLGFNIDESLSNLEEEVNGTGGLVETFNATMKAKQVEIEAAMTLVPIKDKEGNNVSAEYLKGISSGWDVIDGIMTELGQSLSEDMKNAYNEKLDKDLREMYIKSVADITNTMLDISVAVASAQARAKTVGTFKYGLESVSGGSIQGIIDFYKEQKEATRKEMETAYNIYLEDVLAEQYVMEDMMEKARQNNGVYAGKTYEEYEKLYNDYKDMYERLIQLRDSSVSAALDFYTTGEGLDMIRNVLVQKLGEALSPEKIKPYLRGGNSNYVLATIAEMVASGVNTEDKNQVDRIKSLISGYIDQIMRSALSEEDYNTYFEGLQLGLFTFSDIFSEPIMDAIFGEIEKQIGGGVEAKEKIDELKKVFIEALGGKRTIGEAAENAAEEAQNTAKDAVEAAGGAETANIGLNAEVEINNTNDIMESVKKQIQDAVESGVSLNDLSFEIMAKYGADVYNDAMRELNYVMDEMGYVIGKRPITTTSMLSRTGTPAAGFNTTPSEPTNVDTTDVSAGVQSGTQAGFSQLAELLQRSVALLNTISMKDLSVNLYPTSSFGRLTNAAQAALGRRTGSEDVMA